MIVWVLIAIFPAFIGVSCLWIHTAKELFKECQRVQTYSITLTQLEKGALKQHKEYTKYAVVNLERLK